MLQKDIPAVHTFGARVAMMQGLNDGLFLSDDQLGRMHASDDSVVVVAKEHARIIGLLVAMLNRSSGIAIITHFYVEVPYRSRGVREGLLNRFRSVVPKMCISSASLPVKLIDMVKEQKFLDRQCKASSSPLRLFEVDLTMKSRE